MSLIFRIAAVSMVSLALVACSPSDDPETSADQEQDTATSQPDAQSSTGLPYGCENLEQLYSLLPSDDRVGGFDRNQSFCSGFQAVVEYSGESDGYEFHVQVLDGESPMLSDEVAAMTEDGSEAIAHQMTALVSGNGEAFREALQLCEQLADQDDSVAHTTDSGVCVMEESENVWLARKLPGEDVGLMIRFYAISDSAAKGAAEAARQIEPLFEEFTMAAE